MALTKSSNTFMHLRDIYSHEHSHLPLQMLRTERSVFLINQGVKANYRNPQSMYQNCLLCSYLSLEIHMTPLSSLVATVAKSTIRQCIALGTSTSPMMVRKGKAVALACSFARSLKLPALSPPQHSVSEPAVSCSLTLV